MTDALLRPWKVCSAHLHSPVPTNRPRREEHFLSFMLSAPTFSLTKSDTLLLNHSTRVAPAVPTATTRDKDCTGGTSIPRLPPRRLASAPPGARHSRKVELMLRDQGHISSSRQCGSPLGRFPLDIGVRNNRSLKHRTTIERQNLKSGAVWH